MVKRTVLLGMKYMFMEGHRETATILLDNGDKVNRFVTAMSKYRCPIHLTTKRYKVDAKSLIGIFGMVNKSLL